MKRPKHKIIKEVSLIKISEDKALTFSQQVELPSKSKPKKFPLSDYLIKGNIDHLGVTYQPSFSEMARFEKFGGLVDAGEFLSTLEYTLIHFKKILVRKTQCITIPWFLGNYKFLKNYHVEGCTKPEYRRLEEAIEKYETKIIEIDEVLRRKRR